jgi:hypothetical protein
MVSREIAQSTKNEKQEKKRRRKERETYDSMESLFFFMQSGGNISAFSGFMARRRALLTSTVS